MSKIIGLRLLEIRKLLGISQKEISKKLGISLSGWQNMELGSYIPSGKNLDKLANLGFNPGWILTGEGNMKLDDGNLAETNKKFISQPGFSESSQEHIEFSLYQNVNAANKDLMSRCFEAVSKVYTELNIPISIRYLGEVAAENIITISSNPTNWPAMVSYMAAELKKELQKNINDPNKNKDIL